MIPNGLITVGKIIIKAIIIIISPPQATDLASYRHELSVSKTGYLCLNQSI
jgi:hypothetical protein